ncbi:hypothetical protein [Enterobacter cloacae]|uniref:hypothetical protein n=1 Tax=Enterobacter cloacae TaxID=550 RepID=UPI003F44BBA9
MKHIIKFPLENNKKESWCGAVISPTEWAFEDAQHALLSIEQGSLVQPCKECLKAIVKVAQQEVKP